MHVMAVSEVTDNDRFWSAVKKANGKLPKGARWALAVASVDGSTAVNVIVHDTVDDVKTLLEPYTGAFGTTRYLEADAANAVGLPK